MASVRGARTVREGVPVPVRMADYDMRSEDETEDAMDESKDVLSECDDQSDEEIEPSVQDDIHRFEQSFKNISQRFRLINRIGEGWSSIFSGCLSLD